MDMDGRWTVEEHHHKATMILGKAHLLDRLQEVMEVMTVHTVQALASKALRETNSALLVGA